MQSNQLSLPLPRDEYQPNLFPFPPAPFPSLSAPAILPAVRGSDEGQGRGGLFVPGFAPDPSFGSGGCSDTPTLVRIPELNPVDQGVI